MAWLADGTDDGDTTVPTVLVQGTDSSPPPPLDQPAPDAAGPMADSSSTPDSQLTPQQIDALTATPLDQPIAADYGKPKGKGAKASASSNKQAAMLGPLLAGGVAANIAGTPGDFESLVRGAINNYSDPETGQDTGAGVSKDTVAPTTGDLDKYLPSGGMNDLAVGVGNNLGPAALAEGAPAVAKAIGPLVDSGLTKYMSDAGFMPSAVKTPGGNFMPPGFGMLGTGPGGSNMLQSYQDAANTPEAKQWVGKKVNDYIRNQLGTAQDPLIQQQFSNKFNPDLAYPDNPNNLPFTRKEFAGNTLANGMYGIAQDNLNVPNYNFNGAPINQPIPNPAFVADPANQPRLLFPERSSDKTFPGDQTHQDLTGRSTRTAYENLADGQVVSNRASDVAQMMQRNGQEPQPWLMKDPDAPVYDLKDPNSLDSLGVGHVVNYMNEANNAHKALQSVGGNLDNLATAAQAEGDTEGPANKAYVLAKAGLNLDPAQMQKVGYPAMVAKAAQGRRALTEAVRQAGADPLLDVPGGQWVNLHPNPNVLHAEGGLMQNCLEDGYYDEDTANSTPTEGTSIHSLRDQDGMPSVTTEVNHEILPPYIGGGDTPWEKQAEAQMEADGTVFNSGRRNMLARQMWQEAANAGQIPPIRKINQIYGKQNAPPEQKYVPAIQAYVKSLNPDGMSSSAAKNAQLTQRDGQWMNSDDLASAMQNHPYAQTLAAQDPTTLNPGMRRAQEMLTTSPTDYADKYGEKPEDMPVKLHAALNQMDYAHQDAQLPKSKLPPADPNEMPNLLNVQGHPNLEAPAHNVFADGPNDADFAAMRAELVANPHDDWNAPAAGNDHIPGGEVHQGVEVERHLIGQTRHQAGELVNGYIDEQNRLNRQGADDVLDPEGYAWWGHNNIHPAYHDDLGITNPEDFARGGRIGYAVGGSIDSGSTLGLATFAGQNGGPQASTTGQSGDPTGYLGAAAPAATGSSPAAGTDQGVVSPTTAWQDQGNLPLNGSLPGQDMNSNAPIYSDSGVGANGSAVNVGAVDPAIKDAMSNNQGFITQGVDAFLGGGYNANDQWANAYGPNSSAVGSPDNGDTNSDPNELLSLAKGLGIDTSGYDPSTQQGADSLQTMMNGKLSNYYDVGGLSEGWDGSGSTMSDKNTMYVDNGQGQLVPISQPQSVTPTAHNGYLKSEQGQSLLSALSVIAPAFGGAAGLGADVASGAGEAGTAAGTALSQGTSALYSGLTGGLGGVAGNIGGQLGSYLGGLSGLGGAASTIGSKLGSYFASSLAKKA